MTESTIGYYLLAISLLANVIVIGLQHREIAFILSILYCFGAMIASAVLVDRLCLALTIPGLIGLVLCIIVFRPPKKVVA